MQQEQLQPQPFSRMDRSFLGVWWWTVDRAMLGSIIVLIIVGVAMVASASPAVAQKIGVSDYHFLRKHLIFLIPSICAVIGLSMCKPKLVWRFASLMLLGACIMMIAVLIFGDEVKGARRWISVFGFSIQPSEFLKPSFAVVAAWLMALQKQSMNKVGAYQTEENMKGVFPGFYVAVALYALLIAMLLMQPDLGMTVVVTCVFAVQIFLAGLRFRYLAVLLSLGAGGLLMTYFTFYHVRSRIDRFLYPESGDNYQVERSLDAIKNGGFLGAGPGQGTEKMRIPDAHADFIFSVFAEEMGLVFSMILLAIFTFIILRGFKRLRETQDMFSVLAAGGLLAMFGLQSLIHIGSSVNILPAKGMTLPFLSYGGSSMLSIAIAMGMVLALTRQKTKSSIAKSSITMRRAQNSGS